jgi:hypothetical protein
MAYLTKKLASVRRGAVAQLAAWQGDHRRLLAGRSIADRPALPSRSHNFSKARYVKGGADRATASGTPSFLFESNRLFGSSDHYRRTRKMFESPS